MVWLCLRFPVWKKTSKLAQNARYPKVVIDRNVSKAIVNHPQFYFKWVNKPKYGWFTNIIGKSMGNLLFGNHSENTPLDPYQLPGQASAGRARCWDTQSCQGGKPTGTAFQAAASNTGAAHMVGSSRWNRPPTPHTATQGRPVIKSYQWKYGNPRNPIYVVLSFGSIWGLNKLELTLGLSYNIRKTTIEIKMNQFSEHPNSQPNRDPASYIPIPGHTTGK